jgi:hypothetical protein
MRSIVDELTTKGRDQTNRFKVLGFQFAYGPERLAGQVFLGK